LAAGQEGAQGADKAAGDGRDGQSGGVGGKLPRRAGAPGAVVSVGEDLLDDGVDAVVFLGPGSPQL